MSKRKNRTKNKAIPADVKGDFIEPNFVPVPEEKNDKSPDGDACVCGGYLWNIDGVRMCGHCLRTYPLND